ncbi:MAG: CinA family protein [Lachnospiraceae bacterium]|nr:CinA family protein [Lachnospiraceae bacterium]
MITEQIVAKLNKNHMTIAVAESCTGGMIASSLVDVPGVSECFEEGYVTYSNDAKEKNLGVSHETLIRFGAVSHETAEEMSTGVRARAKATFGLATTGIAGPDGGTADKPVGLVYISCAGPQRVCTEEHIFSGDRTSVRRQATEAAFRLLLRCM